MYTMSRRGHHHTLVLQMLLCISSLQAAATLLHIGCGTSLWCTLLLQDFTLHVLMSVHSVALSAARVPQLAT